MGVVGDPEQRCIGDVRNLKLMKGHFELHTAKGEKASRHLTMDGCATCDVRGAASTARAATLFSATCAHLVQAQDACSRDSLARRRG